MHKSSLEISKDGALLLYFVGDNQMYQAGDPIGYADLTTDYWQEHLIGAGRIQN